MSEIVAAPVARVGLGVVLVALGAMCYGILPVFLEILRDENVPSGVSLVVRYFGAVVPLGIWVLLRKPAWHGVVLSLAAGAGLGGGTIFLFEGYARLPASMTVLIFYTYPAFTLLIVRSVFGVAMEPRMIAVIALVIGAAALILSPGGGESVALWAILVTFGAPLGYGTYLSCLGRLPNTVDVGLRTFLLSWSALAVAVGYHLAAEDHFGLPVTGMGWVAMLYMAAVTGLIATGLVVIGTSMAGSSRAAVAGSAELVTVLLLGWLFLGEAVLSQQVFGAVVIFAAILFSLPRRKNASG